MAEYHELRELFGNDALRNKVEVACIVAAETIRGESAVTDNHANRVIWAKKAFNSPGSVRDEMLMALLAAHKDSTVPAITGASDAAVQTKVDAAIDVFADGT